MEKNQFGQNHTNYHSRIVKLSRRRCIANALLVLSVNFPLNKSKNTLGHLRVSECQRSIDQFDWSLIFPTQQSVKQKEYPLPTIDKTLQDIWGLTFASVIDLNMAYLSTHLLKKCRRSLQSLPCLVSLNAVYCQCA